MGRNSHLPKIAPAPESPSPCSPIRPTTRTVPAHPRSPLKILIFTHQYLPRLGGVQIAVDNFVRYLEERGDIDVVLVCPRYRDEDTAHERRGQISIHRLFNPDHKGSVGSIFVRLLRVARSEKPDLIHAQTLIPDTIFCIPTSLLLGIPLIASTHGELNCLKRPSLSLRAKGKTFLAAFLSRFCRALIADEPGIGEKLRQHLRHPHVHTHSLAIRVGPAERAAMADGVALKRLGLSQDRYFIYLGRLVREKGLMELLVAARDTCEHWARHDMKILLSGRGPLEAELRAYIRQHSLGHFVVMDEEPHPDTKWSLLAQARALILPSWEENLPLVILEAFHAGVPTLASDIDVHRNLIDHPGLGQLFRVKDPSALGKALITSMEQDFPSAISCFETKRQDYDMSICGEAMVERYRTLISV